MVVREMGEVPGLCLLLALVIGSLPHGNQAREPKGSNRQETSRRAGRDSGDE